jgi:hypothetical protein
MQQLIEIAHDPKVLELEKEDDGRLRLVITLRKLGVVTKLDFFLTHPDAQALGRALGAHAG